MGHKAYSEVSVLSSFLNLEKLEVNQGGTKDIIFICTKTNSKNKLISPLDTLTLNNLPELKYVWSGLTGTLSLQNLREFRVSGCNNLRTIFSPIILRSMQLLVGNRDILMYKVKGAVWT